MLKKTVTFITTICREADKCWRISAEQLNKKITKNGTFRFFLHLPIPHAVFAL